MSVRVLVVPDKFKGTLTARQAAMAIARGWSSSRPNDVIETLPMADGGEGFGEVLGQLVNARRRTCATVDAASRVRVVEWWFEPTTRVAVIETAQVNGLALFPRGQFHPFQLDTFGVGAVLRDAERAGAAHVYVGVGGSATNDGGAGMAQALGYRLLNKRGEELGGGGARLVQLDRIDASGRHPRLSSVNFYVACDVDNPLCGPQGASAVYGPQKGATSEDILILDHALSHFAGVVARDMKVSLSDMPGAGAAGGLAGGLMAFAGAKLENGLDLIATLCGLHQALAGADLVITGEGSLDRQSTYGKTPSGVARLARAFNVPVIALGGRITQEADALRDHGVTALFSICPGPMSLKEARANASENLRFTARQLARLWAAARG